MIDCHLVFMFSAWYVYGKNEKTRYEIPFITTAAKYDTMFRVFVL
jgi:hypothetical protein